MLQTKEPALETRGLSTFVISKGSGKTALVYCNFGNFPEGFSFVKIKSSQNGEITLSFTMQLCLLTLLAKIKFPRKFPNLQ